MPLLFARLNYLDQLVRKWTGKYLENFKNQFLDKMTSRHKAKLIVTNAQHDRKHGTLDSDHGFGDILSKYLKATLVADR